MRDFHIGYEILTSSEFNKHLKYIKEHDYIIKWFSYEDAMECNALSTFPYVAYIKIMQVNITITYKKENKWISFKHNLAESDNKEDLIPETDPKTSYATLQKYCHFPDLKGYYGYQVVEDKIWWNILNIGGIRFFNSEFVGQRIDNCISYDMNSAFLSACIDLPIPDTNQLVGTLIKPQKNEIGFNQDGNPVFGESDKICLYVFKSYISLDLNRWAKKKYEQKQKATNKAEKQKYKDMANFAIGNIARHNPFIRNCILYVCNQRMLSLMDNNTILCNTDSIVSKEPRNDLPIGNGLGQFKIEKKGKFALNHNGYQWENELPTISGFTKKKAEIFKKIVGRDYDILKDGMLDDFFLPRCFNVNKLKIEKRNIDEEFKNYLRGIYGKI